MKLTHKMVMVLLMAALVATSAHAKRKATIYNLGPTGLFGTVSKTTAKVTSVAKGSPADGKIRKGDQLIGAGESKFKKDVRRELAAAINKAETKEGGGTLTLILKGGKT